MYGGHEYEFGTRQPLGEVITGQRLLEQVAGQYSIMINVAAILEERKKFGQTVAGNLLHNYEGPGQLNIEKDDIVLLPKTLKTKLPAGVLTELPFVSFNGSWKFPSARDYRLYYRFAGLALTPFAFNNDCQGKGITVQARGVGNFINRTGKVIMPGDLLTWEPNLDHFDQGDPSPPKRMKIAGSVALKARFAKYEPVDAAGMAGLKTKIGELMGGDGDYHYEMLPLTEIVGRSAECTQPNEWGRIILA